MPDLSTYADNLYLNANTVTQFRINEIEIIEFDGFVENKIKAGTQQPVFLVKAGGVKYKMRMNEVHISVLTRHFGTPITEEWPLPHAVGVVVERKGGAEWITIQPYSHSARAERLIGSGRYVQ